MEGRNFTVFDLCWNTYCYMYMYPHSGDVILQSDGRLSVYISCLCQSSEVHILHFDSHSHRCLYLVPPWLLLTEYVWVISYASHACPFLTHLPQVLQFQLGHCSWHTFQQLTLSHPRLHHIPLLGLGHSHICRLWWCKCTQCAGDGVCIGHTTHWNHVVRLLPWYHRCYPHECSQLQVHVLLTYNVIVYMCTCACVQDIVWGEDVRGSSVHVWEQTGQRPAAKGWPLLHTSLGSVQVSYMHTHSDICCCDLIFPQRRDSPWGSRFNARHASHSETRCIHGRVFQPPVKGSLLPACGHFLSSSAL